MVGTLIRIRHCQRRRHACVYSSTRLYQVDVLRMMLYTWLLSTVYFVYTYLDSNKRYLTVQHNIPRSQTKTFHNYALPLHYDVINCGLDTVSEAGGVYKKSRKLMLKSRTSQHSAGFQWIVRETRRLFCDVTI